MIKVVFFGSGGVETSILGELDKNFELALIVNSKDVRSREQLEEVLKGTDAQIGVVVNFGHIIPKSVIDHFPKGILNVHPSLLPKYRGPTPVQTVILNEDKKTGVTIIKIDEQVDHGPILLQKEVEVSESDTSKTLLKKLFELGAEMLPKVLSNYIKGQIKISEQRHEDATFTKVLTKKDGFIDLNNSPSPEKLDRMIRAFYPWPGVWFKTDLGGRNLIIKLLPGKKIQVGGKKSMGYKDFINGYKEGEGILSKLGLF